MQNDGNYKEVLARIDGLHELTESCFNTNEKDHNSIIARLDKVNGTIREHEMRIGGLERWKYWIIGIFSAIVFIIDIIFNHFT